MLADSPMADAQGQELELDSDCLQLCLAYLDAFQLGRAAAVCRAWRDATCADDLWVDLVHHRWKLKQRKHGRYKHGWRTWAEVYRGFHRRHRVPSLPGMPNRQMVYASGRMGRVCCWLFVNHQPACRLAERERMVRGMYGQYSSWRQNCLTCRVVLQNLRTSPIVLGAQETSIGVRMRDGLVAHPLPDERSEGGEGSSVLIAPLEAVCLANVALPAPQATMAFEPDVLEACQTLMVRVEAQGQGGGVLEVPCAFVEEASMWKHYEVIARDFYVHVEPDDDDH
jgi:hypothetical protein